jgi:hypothetical protein
MGSVITSIELAIDHPIDAASRSSATRCRACRQVLSPGRDSRRAQPEAGKDHLGYDRYVVDTGAAFPYFREVLLLLHLSAGLLSTTTRSGRATSSGAETKSFPTVIMLSAPPPSDLPDADRRPQYPRIRRS